MSPPVSSFKFQQVSRGCHHEKELVSDYHPSTYSFIYEVVLGVEV